MYHLKFFWFSILRLYGTIFHRWFYVLQNQKLVWHAEKKIISYPFINYESDERRQYHIFGFSKSWAHKSRMGPLCQPLIQILFVCIQLFNTVICSYSITITLIHSALSNYATTANYPQPSSMTFALNQ